MAPAAITVDHVTTGANGDKLSVTLMDVAAVMWINKLDPRLYDRVKVEFAVRIKNGDCHQWSQTSPRLSPAC